MNDELNFMFSYHGLRTLDCYDSEFITKQFFRHLTGLLGRGIGISQGSLVTKATQQRKTRKYIRDPTAVRTSNLSVLSDDNDVHSRQRSHCNRNSQINSQCSFI